MDAQASFSVSLVKDYPRPQLIIGLQSKEKQLLAELQSGMKRQEDCEVLTEYV